MLYFDNPIGGIFVKYILILVVCVLLVGCEAKTQDERAAKLVELLKSSQPGDLLVTAYGKVFYIERAGATEASYGRDLESMPTTPEVLARSYPNGQFWRRGGLEWSWHIQRWLGLEQPK